MPFIRTPATLFIGEKDEEEETRIGSPAPPWMVSYSDLMTQILVFFVMLFVLAAAVDEDQLKRLKCSIDEYIEKNNLPIHTVINERGIVISVEASYMFDPGKADIYPQAKRALADIAKFIIKAPNNVKIEGHTDNMPIPPHLQSEFPTNWELSTARATNVARYLIDSVGFPPRRIASAGYGEYHPVITPIAKGRWSIMEKEYLKEAQHNFVKKLSEEIPPEYRKYLPLIQPYLLVEGADWTRLVKKKMPDSLIEEIMSKEAIESQKYELESKKRLIESCNLTKEDRALNRRVDIVVERLGGRFRAVQRTIRAKSPVLPQ